MNFPASGTTSTCGRCQQPIEFWDGNPDHVGAYWFHVREYTPDQLRWGWKHSTFCNEDQAVPAIGGAPCAHTNIEQWPNERYNDTCRDCGLTATSRLDQKVETL